MFDSLKNIFKTAGNAVKKIGMQPVSLIKRAITKLLSVTILITAVMTWFKGIFSRILIGKPQSFSDYFSFKKTYVAKKLVFIIALLLIGGAILYVQFGHKYVYAFFTQVLSTPTIEINSVQMAEYSGKAKIVYADGRKIYSGDIKEGHMEGVGSLYDGLERLVYKGGFVMDMFSGTGELYYPEIKRLNYKGDFLYSRFDGSGVLYYTTGTMQYEGKFANGLYEGPGSLYYDNGVLQYQGSFLQGAYNGKGTLYEKNGKILYDGSFSNNEYDGQGKLYENGSLIYSGGFYAGLYEGYGCLYKNGRIVYDGNFVQGQYSGYGVLYNSDGSILYTGSFDRGAYHGQGTLYKDRAILYSGGFADGLYEGAGRLDGIDGAQYGTTELYYEGSFLQGKFSGTGKLTLKGNGSVLYAGSFDNGKFSGAGKLFNRNSLVYDGEFYDSVYEGYGKLYDGNNPVYDGSFKSGKYEGYGKLYENSVLIYEGNFIQDKFNGNGLLYKEGMLRYDGMFINNEFVSGTEFDDTGKPVAEKIAPAYYAGMVNWPIDNVSAALDNAKVQYTTLGLSDSYLLILKNDGVIIEFRLNEKKKITTVKNVLLVNYSGYDKVIAGLPLEEISKQLRSEPLITAEPLTVSEQLALSMRNVNDGMTLLPSQISGATYAVDSSYLTVYYYTLRTVRETLPDETVVETIIIPDASKLETERKSLPEPLPDGTEFAATGIDDEYISIFFEIR